MEIFCKMENIIEINGMKFEKTRLLPNFQGVYDSDPCSECHLNIHWVDYGGKCLCGKIDCARINRKEPYVYCIAGGVENLKNK
jgi:hypothetical protein